MKMIQFPSNVKVEAEFDDVRNDPTPPALYSEMGTQFSAAELLAESWASSAIVKQEYFSPMACAEKSTSASPANSVEMHDPLATSTPNPDSTEFKNLGLFESFSQFLSTDLRSSQVQTPETKPTSEELFSQFQTGRVSPSVSFSVQQHHPYLPSGYQSTGIPHPVAPTPNLAGQPTPISAVQFSGWNSGYLGQQVFPTPPSRSVSVFVCPVCRTQGFAGVQELERHLCADHLGWFRFLCIYCQPGLQQWCTREDLCTHMNLCHRGMPFKIARPTPSASDRANYTWLMARISESIASSRPCVCPNCQASQSSHFQSLSQELLSNDSPFPLGNCLPPLSSMGFPTRPTQSTDFQQPHFPGSFNPGINSSQPAGIFQSISALPSYRSPMRVEPSSVTPINHSMDSVELENLLMSSVTPSLSSDATLTPSATNPTPSAAHPQAEVLTPSASTFSPSEAHSHPEVYPTPPLTPQISLSPEAQAALETSTDSYTPKLLLNYAKEVRFCGRSFPVGQKLILTPHHVMFTVLRHNGEPERFFLCLDDVKNVQYYFGAKKAQCDASVPDFIAFEVTKECENEIMGILGEETLEESSDRGPRFITLVCTDKEKVNACQCVSAARFASFWRHRVVSNRSNKGLAIPGKAPIQKLAARQFLSFSLFGDSRRKRKRSELDGSDEEVDVESL